MPRIPVTISTGGLGTSNPATRSGPAPSMQTLGPAQSREQFRDRQQNRTQSAIRIATSKVKALPFSDGNLVSGVAFTSGGTTAVSHGLGRPFSGYVVLNVTGGYGSFQLIANSDSRLDATQVQIKSGNNCTGDVWVY